MKLLLSNKERKLISQIVTDQQSGNYLLRERTSEYWKMYRCLQMAYSKADNIRTEVECQMFEYALACEDFNKYREFCYKYGIDREKELTKEEILYGNKKF